VLRHTNKAIAKDILKIIDFTSCTSAQYHHEDCRSTESTTVAAPKPFACHHHQKWFSTSLSSRRRTQRVRSFCLRLLDRFGLTSGLCCCCRTSISLTLAEFLLLLVYYAADFHELTALMKRVALDVVENGGIVRGIHNHGIRELVRLRTSSTVCA